jgi:hypothetical protein
MSIAATPVTLKYISSTANTTRYLVSAVQPTIVPREAFAVNISSEVVPLTIPRSVQNYLSPTAPDPEAPPVL